MKFLPRSYYRVGKSRTGLGLFALKPIKKGTLIIEYKGRKMRAEKADELDTKYVYEINSRWSVDGASRSNIARYGNHSCRPNAESDTRGHTIFIRATKNIEAGQEITYDYGSDYFKAFIKPHGCLCDKCIAKRKAERAEQRLKAKRAKARKERQAEKLKEAARAAAKRKKARTKAKAAKVSVAKVKAAKVKANPKARATLSKTASQQAVATPELRRAA
jgi:SET domain-containing protein